MGDQQPNSNGFAASEARIIADYQAGKDVH